MLAHLLRPATDESSITDSETHIRDDFDICLSYYSIVEIAVCCGAVAELSEPDTKAARSFLQLQAVSDYYTLHYPLCLPRAHLSRIRGKPVIPAGEFSPGGEGLFGTFFELSGIDRAELYTPIETFLWFLDDGARMDDEGGWHDILDTLAAVRSPRRFLRCVAKVDDPNPTELSVQGLVEFLHFCTEFDGFLSRVHPLLLRSLFWHFFAHWFVHLREQFEETIGDALARMREWDRKMHDTFSQKRHRHAIRDYEGVITRLCDDRQGRPVSRLVSES